MMMVKMTKRMGRNRKMQRKHMRRSGWTKWKKNGTRRKK